MNLIKSAAGWSENSKVFFKFYNRPINDGSNEFAVNLFDHNDRIINHLYNVGYIYIYTSFIYIIYIHHLHNVGYFLSC